MFGCSMIYTLNMPAFASFNRGVMTRGAIGRTVGVRVGFVPAPLRVRVYAGEGTVQPKLTRGVTRALPYAVHHESRMSSKSLKLSFADR